MARSIRISENLHLWLETLDTTVKATVPSSVIRAYMADISGSMYVSAAQMRANLKNSISTTVARGDLVCIGYFSGKNQFGMIAEAVRVDNAVDLTRVFAAIDKYLHPIGLTGFLQPLQELSRMAVRLKASNPGMPLSVVFMSDGRDNQWPRRDILEAAEELAEHVSGGAVVEYGWYADQPMLTAIAQTLGVPYVLAQDIDKFGPILDEEFRKPVGGARRRQVRMSGTPLGDACFAVIGGAVTEFMVSDDGTVKLPGDVAELFYLSAAPAGEDGGAACDVPADSPFARGLYAALAVLSQHMEADGVLAILRSIGDVRLVRMFANCFGKQSYGAFHEAASAAASEPRFRFSEGRDLSLVPPDDAYTVLHALDDLMAGTDNMLHLGHPDWDYRLTGRRALPSVGNLTDAEKAEIEVLTARARNGADLAAITARLSEIAASKPKPLKFVPAPDTGVPLSNIVFNEDRPNVAVHVVQEGMVEVGHNPVGLPAAVPSVKHRTYVIVRDGINHTPLLPVSLDRQTHAKLVTAGLVSEPWVDGAVYVVDLAKLPIINRAMVSRVSATECFGLQLELEHAGAASKVFAHYSKQAFPPDRSTLVAAKFGAEAAAWLAERGLTDNGFNPKSSLAEATDTYVGRELTIKVEGLSNLPSVAKVEEKMAKVAAGTGRKPATLTASEAIMEPFVREYREFLASPVYTGAPNQEEIHKAWLTGKAKWWLQETRRFRRRMAEIKFSICVGQVWFPEFNTIGEGSLVVVDRVTGDKVKVTARLAETEVEV